MKAFVLIIFDIFYQIFIFKFQRTIRYVNVACIYIRISDYTFKFIIQINDLALFTSSIFSVLINYISVFILNKIIPAFFIKKTVGFLAVSVGIINPGHIFYGIVLCCCFRFDSILEKYFYKCIAENTNNQ